MTVCWGTTGGGGGTAAICAVGVAIDALASVSPAAFFAFSSSSCMALTSDLRMRNERPTPRAASGSFLAPKSRMNTARMIIQCHHDNPPENMLCLPGPERLTGADCAATSSIVCSAPPGLLMGPAPPFGVRIARLPVAAHLDIDNRGPSGIAGHAHMPDTSAGTSDPQELTYRAAANGASTPARSG